MKHFSKGLIAIVLALLMATLFPAQVFADTPDYISEIKIGMGEKAEDAKKTLSGYKILDVDLNQNAGGGWGSKGEKAVYLGYKTTKNKNEAVTDLALMNMKGGYDTVEYEILMEKQMKSQILPFIESFQKAIDEYRVNYSSKIKANKARAQYIHDALNKLIDDDTGSPLGDLLLNKTKQELGDEAYNALSGDEKKQHADLATIIAQSNGRAMLLMEMLLVRATDTNETTFVDRFKDTTYDELINNTGKSPTDARKQIAKLYDDDAQQLLESWDSFKEALDSYDNAVKTVDEFDNDEAEEIIEQFNNLDEDTTEEEATEIIEKYNEIQKKLAEITECARIIAIHDTLSKIEYADGTMLDFFTQDSIDIEDDITVLYPLVASLTEGQRAGLEFVSLEDLFAIALTGSKGYQKKEFDDLKEASVYEGVDRAIYQKGGVALTSESLRKDALSKTVDSGNPFSTLSIVFMALTGLVVAGFIASVGTFIGNRISALIFNHMADVYRTGRSGMALVERFPKLVDTINQGGTIEDYYALNYSMRSTHVKLLGKLAAGFTVALVIFAGITTYLSWRDLKEHYKVEFTPIPHYMIDEKDLIGYNSKGEKIILKNQSAYYKAVECNRNSNDEFYNVLGTCADMNGDVGKQWLALYAEKNEMENPIIASSLKAVVDSADIPAGYETGIHMFGSSAALNLNSNAYDWNGSAESVYVYFKTDSAQASETGTNFSAGALALAGGGGIALGAVITALGMTANKTRKDNKTLTA